MTEYNRERERKFTVEGLTYAEAYSVLNDRYSLRLDGTSYDLYWAGSNVDFIRLRENSRELTVKVTDKATVVDRIEENVVVDKGSMDSARAAMSLVFGEPTKLTKRFSVFDTLCHTAYSNHYEHVVICLYTVANDPKNRVFLEVEAPELHTVDRVVTDINRKLILTAVPFSLYQIFKEGL